VSLHDSLQQLDPLFCRLPTSPELRPGASPEDLRLLEQRVSGGLPDDLRVWFEWHDGQENPAALSPDTNWTLLSLAQALAAWRFFTDPSQEFLLPYEKHWFPLFGNGGGDHLVYVLGKPDRAALVEYWHDDAERPVAYAGLREWAEEARKALRALPLLCERPVMASWESVPPEQLTLYVGCVVGCKNLGVAKRVREIARVPLSGLVSGMKAGAPKPVFTCALGSQPGCLERASAVRSVLKIRHILEEAGIESFLAASEDGTSTTVPVDVKALEALATRCIS
jgi:hypothetical protein